MKQYSISKLKKQYELYLDKIFGPKETNPVVQVKDTFYSKLFLIPSQTLPSNVKISVPLDMMGFYSKKKINLVYVVDRVDHTERKVYAKLKQLALVPTYGQTSNFEFNRNLALKTKSLDLKMKILLNKRPVKKTCSKPIQKQIVKDVAELLLREGSLNSVEDVCLAILTRSLSKRIASSLSRNVEYFKALIIVRAVSI